MYSLSVGDNISRNAAGATQFNITTQMRHWRDSIHDVGGFWQASGQYWTGDDTDIVTRLEAEQFFATRLGAHIVRADEAGATQWEGQVTEMTLTADGITRRRAIADIVTKLRIAYTRYTGNLLLNGSGELGTWTAVGAGWEVLVNAVQTIRTFNQSGSIHPDASFSTAWYTHGTRSVRVDTTPLDEADGGGVEFKTATAAVPDARYSIRADIYLYQLGSGANITVTVNDGTKQIYGRVAMTATGTLSFARMFDAPADAGGNLSVLVFCPSGAAGSDDTIFYVDNVQIYEAGSPAMTPWSEDTAATAEWGLHEETIVCKPMTDAEALQRRDVILANWAVPRTHVTGTVNPDERGLTVSCEGYIFKTASQSVGLGGVKACSTHITDLLTGNAYITAGYVATNATEMYVDETQAVGLWPCLQDVIEVGGATNTVYVGGVYAGRKFNYEPRSTTAAIKFKDGHWLNMDNSPMNPQTARPCIAYFEDTPQAEGQGNYATILDNPCYAWIPGWEFDGDTMTATPIEIVEMH